MCGILGLLNLFGPLDHERYSLPNNTNVLHHRGPDGFGYFIDDRVYLAHRRLSIIDLTFGSQPMYNEDQSVCVVFNGEIFNFQEIRNELAKKGHIFKTNSDTEVIVHSYEEYGEACVDKFRGMFAFAVWDMAKKSLFLARDRLGIKPLFYAIHNGVLHFASEMKAILQYRGFPKEINFDGLASYFTLSYIPNPLTIYRHIQKLPPGNTMKIRNGKVEIKQYWDLHFSPDRSKSQDYYIEGLTTLFDESVRLRMISDVPLGAFLSGGMDSGAVVASMSKASLDPIRTFCIGFGGNTGGYLDERPYAVGVAQQYSTIHEEYEVVPDFQDLIKDIAQSFDEPFADSGSIPSFYVCKTAKSAVTVALSGLGGDELFGGYERYLGFKLSIAYNRLPRFLRNNIIKQIVERIPERADGHYTVNHLKRFVRWASEPQASRYLGFISMLGQRKQLNLFAEPEKYVSSFEYCRDMVRDLLNAPNATEPLDKIFYFDFKTYLPEDILALTDRMSMRHSLEVRVPFLDHKLVEFCATIPSEMKVTFRDKKHIFKKALTGVLPSSVLNHRKQGFIGPMSNWIQSDLKGYVFDTLQKRNLDKHGLFNIDNVNDILYEHFHRIEMHDKLIWSLVMFQSWYDLYIEHNFPVSLR